MSKWLLSNDAHYEISELRALATQADFRAFNEFKNGETESRSVLDVNSSFKYEKAGSTARIHVSGILTPELDFWSWLFGGNTTYRDLIQSIDDSNRDSDVSEIEMLFDTPGGNVAGLYDAALAIRNSEKPIKGFVGNMAASAGFILLSQCSETFCVNESSMVGSFGVVQSFRLNDKMLEVTNDDSPNKRPDLKSEAGIKVIKEELNEVFDLFLGLVAESRNVTKQEAIDKFGKGSMFLAEKAKLQGMVDGVESSTTISTSEPDAGATNLSLEADSMSKLTLAELQQSNPDLCEDLKKQGAATELDKAKAHFLRAQASGGYVIFAAALESGELDMTESIKAKYDTFKKAEASEDSRLKDDKNTSKATDNADDQQKTAEELDAELVAEVQNMVAEDWGYKAEEGDK